MRILIALLFLIASGFAQNTPYRWTISTRSDNAGNATVNWNIVDSTGNAVQSNISTVFPFNDDNAIKEVLDLLTLKAQRAALNATSGSSMPAPMLDWSRIANKPSTFNPAAHTHPESEITNLVTDLAGKAAIAHSHVKANITDFAHGATSHDSTVSQNIAKGTATFATTAIAAAACSAVVTVSAPGVTTSDVISWSYQAQPAAATNGKLTMQVWPTANAVNFCRQNNTAASVTPTAISINWQVTR